MKDILVKKNKKSKKLVIFGNSDFARLMAYYFEKESDYTVCAFTADDEYCNEKHFDGKALIPFSQLKESCPADDYEIFIAIGYQKLNKIREAVFSKVQSMGYTCANFISIYATIQNEYNIGSNCALFAGVILCPFSVLGDNNILLTQTVIAHDCIVGSHNYFAGGVIFGGFCKVGNSNFFGNNATIRDKVEIGDSCLIGMSSVITKNIQDNSFTKVKQTLLQESTTDELFETDFTI